MAVTHDAPAAIVGLQFGGRGQKLGHFRFDRLGQKGARPIAQDFRQPIGQSPWLNQFENVIVRHKSLAARMMPALAIPMQISLARVTASMKTSGLAPPVAPRLSAAMIAAV